METIPDPGSSESQKGILFKELQGGDQIVAPVEGNATFEYNEKDRQPDGSLNRGKVVIVSKDGMRLTLEADNIQLLLGSNLPTVRSEDGTVKSSQEIPVKGGELLFTIKNSPSELHVNVPQGTPTPGGSSSVV